MNKSNLPCYTTMLKSDNADENTSHTLVHKKPSKTICAPNLSTLAKYWYNTLMLHHVWALSEIYWRSAILVLQAYGNVCHKCENPMTCIWFSCALFWFYFQLIMDSFDLFSYIILGCIAGSGKMNDCPVPAKYIEAQTGRIFRRTYYIVSV